MKKVYSRNFPLLIAKDASILVGAICWLFLFAQYSSLAGSNYYFSAFQIAPQNYYAGIVIYALIGALVIYGGLIIGLSFLKGKARSITSIIFASILLLDCIGLTYAINKTGSYLFASVKSGYGAYIFMVACVAVIVCSAFDLYIMSNNSGYDYSGDTPYFDDYGDDGQTVITNQRGTVSCLGGEYASCNFPISEGEVLVIGKNPSACSVVITQDAQYISSVHCTVKLNNGIYEIYDQSKNGVKVDGSTIPQNCWYRLNEGSIFTLANTNNTFKVG
jgi:hypothetical protein